MISVGYMLKNVPMRPDWLNAVNVVDLYSVSNCISKSFMDYVPKWQHNGWWFFDKPETAGELARNEQIDVSASTLFYYELFEQEFDDQSNLWLPVSGPSCSFETAPVTPLQKHLEGFDVVNFPMTDNVPECSPLSCNGLAAELPVNSHCLFQSLAECKAALESLKFAGCEPGPYRIFGVFRV